MLSEQISSRISELIARGPIEVPASAISHLVSAVSDLRSNNIASASDNLIEAARLIESDAEAQDQFFLAREILVDGHSLALAASNFSIS